MVLFFMFHVLAEAFKIGKRRLLAIGWSSINELILAFYCRSTCCDGTGVVKERTSQQSAFEID